MSGAASDTLSTSWYVERRTFFVVVCVFVFLCFCFCGERKVVWWRATSRVWQQVAHKRTCARALSLPPNHTTTHTHTHYLQHGVAGRLALARVLAAQRPRRRRVDVEVDRERRGAFFCLLCCLMMFFSLFEGGLWGRRRQRRRAAQATISNNTETHTYRARAAGGRA